MKLLLKREQTKQGIGRINFQLWAKLEPEEEEQKLIDKYQFNNAILAGELQEGLLRRAAILGIVVWFVIGLIGSAIASVQIGGVVGLIAGGGFAYWWVNEKREIINVQDLIWGRTFKCTSVIDLAKKESELEDMVSLLRQVMESSKHWDGTETIPVDALPKEEAKQLMLRVF